MKKMIRHIPMPTMPVFEILAFAVIILISAQSG
jgi:hypothetical protein